MTALWKATIPALITGATPIGLGAGYPRMLRGPNTTERDMKTGIHPEHHLTKVKCTCGNTFEVSSRFENLTVDICSACHPFYTGTQKFVDTAGRVDAFTKRFAWTGDKAAEKAKEKAKTTRRTVAKDLKTELEKKKVFGKQKVVPTDEERGRDKGRR